MSLKKLLETDEGRVPFAYQDSLGYWTIGVGHLVDRRKGGKLPDHIIDLLLEWDIKQKTDEVVAALPWVANLTDARRATLISMAFQLGTPGLLNFKTALALLRRGDYNGAADAFLNSKVAREQTPLRWKRHAERIRKGEW